MNFFFPEMLSDRRKSLTIFDCHKSPKLSRADKRRGSFAATLPSSPQDTPTTSGGGKGKRNLMSLSTDRRASFGAPSNGLGGGSGVAHAHKNERRGSYNPPHSGALVQEPIGKVERRGSLVQR
ncbi:hypothetical protein M8J75_008616 [Diaphorina citri]|nr:hypothetical protein M8J75_008616 [Diaphorina citri]KAI5743605.1 hypothetical protein M8J77_020171 [Diaphorina citri]